MNSSTYKDYKGRAHGYLLDTAFVFIGHLYFVTFVGNESFLKKTLTQSNDRGILFSINWYTDVGDDIMSKVTAKYQITIPVKVRKELGIVPGSEVDINKEGDKYVLIVNPINELRKKWQGKFKNSTTTNDYMDKIRGRAN